jgi:hypothetical protein
MGVPGRPNAAVSRRSTFRPTPAIRTRRRRTWCKRGLIHRPSPALMVPSGASFPRLQSATAPAWRFPHCWHPRARGDTGQRRPDRVRVGRVGRASAAGDARPHRAGHGLAFHPGGRQLASASMDLQGSKGKLKGDAQHFFCEAVTKLQLSRRGDSRRAGREGGHCR